MDADNSSSDSNRFSDSTTAKVARSAGGSLSSAGRSMIDSARSDAAARTGPVSYKRGGKVRATGPALLHKGERVIPRGKVKRVEKAMRKGKMRMKAGR